MATSIAAHASGTTGIRWTAFACRLVVGLIFLAAGIAKITAPANFVSTLLAYSILPVAVVRPFALTLPWIEAAIGAYLLVGLFSRAAAWAAIAMLAVFSAAIGQAVLRGLNLENCGCFGDLTTTYPLLALLLGSANAGPADIVRDAIYAALALVVALSGLTPFGVDEYLARRRAERDLD